MTHDAKDVTCPSLTFSVALRQVSNLVRVASMFCGRRSGAQILQSFTGKVSHGSDTLRRSTFAVLKEPMKSLEPNYRLREVVYILGYFCPASLRGGSSHNMIHRSARLFLKLGCISAERQLSNIYVIGTDRPRLVI